MQKLYRLTVVARSAPTLYMSAFALSGCASIAATGVGLQPAADAQEQTRSARAALPAAWTAPLPHGGTAAGLAEFWARFKDPYLLELIKASQQDSATVASALARLEAARAARVGAGAALLPGVNASASAQRGGQSPSMPAATSAQLGLQASWEFDLFGGSRAAAQAAALRSQVAEAQWADTKLIVAAETALQYFNYRLCAANLALSRADALSRNETARLSALTEKAGILPPATLALAQASAAEGEQRALEVSAQCDVIVKGLVALTSLPEAGMRATLAKAEAVPDLQATAALFGIDAVPAKVLSQRLDVWNAERELMAAALEMQSAKTADLPRISLSGSVGAARLSSQGFSQSGAVWNLGPISVSLPIFDGGRNAANARAAAARYDEAAAAYRARLRQAVREVEEALIALSSTAGRTQLLVQASAGYKRSLAASQAKYRAGLGSLIELEDARRISLGADAALLSLQRERVIAWISLYRAAGGGVEPEALAQLLKAS